MEQLERSCLIPLRFIENISMAAAQATIDALSHSPFAYRDMYIIISLSNSEDCAWVAG
jgi:hypothetical protein